MFNATNKQQMQAIMLGLLLTLGTGAATTGVPVADGAKDTPEAAIPPERYEADELLVKFKEVKIPEQLSQDGLVQSLQSVLPAAADQALVMLQAEAIGASPLTGLMRIKIKSGTSVPEAIQLLEQSGTVEYVEPNYLVSSSQVGIHPTDPKLRIQKPVVSAGLTPNDTRFAEQWALNNTGQTGGEVDADIDALEAWSLRTDASTTIVAVLSSGIDYTHDDLAANMWKNPGEICGNGIDDDANGYKDDCYGIDAYLNSGNPKDDNGWGTHMAGIVGAVGNNAKGIAGVAWKARLMGLRFLDADGWGSVADAVQCIDYAIKIKDKNIYPRMVLLSDLVAYPYSKALYDILNTAQSKGILVVTGARPSDDQNVWPAYPAAYDLPNILSVTGSDHKDYRSNMGWGFWSVDMFAPATNILSTWLTQSYKLGTGTTMAAAHVAGASALAWSKNPTMSWKQIKALVLNSAETGLHDAFYWGYSMAGGRLNLNSTLLTTATTTPAIFAVNPASSKAGEKITITGINFGTAATGKTLAFNRGSECTTVFPATSIVSWANEKIVAKVPVACRYGNGSLKVSAGTTQISRGAWVDFNGNEYNNLLWLNPTYQGETLLEHEEAAYAQVGNDIWIISGKSNYGVQTPSVEKFSLLTRRGTVNPDWEIPLPVRYATAAAIGTKIYVVGGYDENTKKVVNLLQIFDTVAGTWTRGRNAPQPLHGASVIAVSGKLWVMGGRTPNNSGLKTNYLYDPATNSWSTKAPLLLKRWYAGAVNIKAKPEGATVADNQIWLLSGYNESSGTWTPTTDVLAYSIANNTWEIRDDISLQGSHAAGGAIAIGNKVFSLYGNDNWNAGEWLGNPDFGAGSGWFRNINWVSGMGNYTPMLGKIGTTVYVISGSRARRVIKFESP